jgi:hypothetical protein
MFASEAWQLLSNVGDELTERRLLLIETSAYAFSVVPQFGVALAELLELSHKQGLRALHRHKPTRELPYVDKFTRRIVLLLFCSGRR